MSTGICLESIRSCLEGVIPAILGTCDTAGVPNVSMISQLHYVDPARIALSYQFFNKTRRNLLETGMATVLVTDPLSVAQYRLDLDYLETREEGPLFESMKAKLSGIASHAGMQDVFRLRGADVFRLRAITPVPGVGNPRESAGRNLLTGVRRVTAALAEARELEELFDSALEGLRRDLGVEHAILLLIDAATRRFYTVASSGYARSGIGSEIAIGDGIIGTAAREGVPIRIGHMTSDHAYGLILRDRAREIGLGTGPQREIPYPGLDAPESQIAVPIVLEGRVLGVLFAESMEPMRFRYDDEDALVLIAERLGEILSRLRERGLALADGGVGRTVAGAHPVVLRHYAVDDSLFMDNEYLIKGVAGAIFWKLAQDYVREGRQEFTNRELRLDPALRLPAHAENLEARLVLLQRRLTERGGAIRLERSGRGRFRLVAPGPFELIDVPAGSAAQGN